MPLYDIDLAMVYFNPRPHAGGDVGSARYVYNWGHFNPRPHAGGDNQKIEKVIQIDYFNPRPHAGGDNSIK